MRLKNIVILFGACLLLICTSINSCTALEEKEYSLEIKMTTSCFPPFQSVAPVVVSVELRNMGNVTFNGTLTISGRTDRGHSYSPIEYPITNLTSNKVLCFEQPFASYDDGIYWFTAEIEPDEVATIKLYQDSVLKDEGFQVQAKGSILLYSFSVFIAIVGIIVGAIVTIAVAIYKKKK